MKREEYIEKYCKEVNRNGNVVLVSLYPECYIGIKSLIDKEKDGLIDFLAEHEIYPLDTCDPKYRQQDSCPVACIGFSEKEQTWYGWSHRGIYGFKIGSEVKKGNVAYCPPNKEDYERDTLDFYTKGDDCIADKWIDNRTDKQFDVVIKYNDKVPNPNLRNKTSSIRCYYPEHYGKGEWKAKTLEDAKKMAMDYAENIG